MPVPAGLTHWQKPTQEYDEYPISEELLSRYFEVLDTPQEAFCIRLELERTDNG